MSLRPVPDDDELSIDGIWLGPGKQVRSMFARPAPVPVAWVTDNALSQPGQHWAGLAEMSASTGLQPILLSGLDGRTERPWDQGEFGEPEDVADIDDSHAAEVLQWGWEGQVPGEEEYAGDEDAQAMTEPFGYEFPGLAPAVHEEGDPRRLALALGQFTPQARIGLVPADRPADVLPRLGWQGTVNRDWSAAEVAAVLRSWEDRFGARLLEVGFADIRLVVSRPPRTLDAALPIAAEHFAFCDECARMGLRYVREIADALVGNPFWDFWWD